MGFITEEGLKQLDKYKYVSGGYSWLDNKMNHFWVAFVNFLPKVKKKKRKRFFFHNQTKNLADMIDIF